MATLRPHLLSARVRGVLTPMARAACTNSIERSDSVWPRTTRAMSIQEKAVMAITTR